MAHYFESGMFAYQPAWHGLGNLVDKSLSAAEAIKAAGLNWGVSVLPCFDHLGNKLPDFCSRTVRNSDNSTLGSVGPDYKPFQNTQLFELAECMTQSGAVFETAGSLKNGRHVWALMNLGENRILDDKTITYLLVTNRHDGGAQVRALVTDVRVVCWNTLSLALGKEKNIIGIRHSGDIEAKLEEAKRVMQKAGDWREKYQKLAIKLVETHANERLMKNIADRLFEMPGGADREKRMLVESKREYLVSMFFRQAGADQKACKDTAYGILQACTEYGDYKVAREAKTVSQAESRMLSIIGGSAADFKEKAFDFLLEELQYSPTSENILENMN